MTFADLEISCVSKALSAEASGRLFSIATKFVFVISFDQNHKTLSRSPERTVTERMMNVEFVVETGASREAAYIWLGKFAIADYEKISGAEDIIPIVAADGEVKERRTLYYPSSMDARCEASVDHFTGSDIERNNLAITFRDFDEEFHLFMPTRFFQTLKKCVGFRTIAVMLEWWGEVEGAFDANEVAEQLGKVRMELEQCWGPCVVTDALEQYKQRTDEDMRLWLAFELAFRPREFHGKNLGRAGVMTDANRVEEVS